VGLVENTFVEYFVRRSHDSDGPRADGEVHLAFTAATALRAQRVIHAAPRPISGDRAI
jgi:hypothetical protein